MPVNESMRGRRSPKRFRPYRCGCDSHIRFVAKQLTITADEWHVLSRVDGRATIADIIRELGMSVFAVCAVLHRLLQTGAVEPVPE